MEYKQPKILKIPTYTWSSDGKHGSRYKKDGAQSIPVVRVSVETCKINQQDFQTLCLLSHFLDEPIRYKSREEKQPIAYIELVAAEDVEELE